MSNKTLNKIVFLGPFGTYCEEAKNVFAKKLGIAESVAESSIKNVIKFVENTPNAAGVIPIENSIEGMVRETMDNLLRASFLPFFRRPFCPKSHHGIRPPSRL